MEINKIYNEKCSVTLKNMIKEGLKIDLVLTSPPYNNSRVIHSERGMNNHEGRYDVHMDAMSCETYCKSVTSLFNLFDKVVKENGVVLWNISYGTDLSAPESIGQSWLSVADIIKNTAWTVADCITWKKASALPNNTSSNKLTRITEYVFVFARKSELKTFHAFKELSQVGKNGQKFYKNYYNFIEARNNDGVCPFNKATYSSELCLKLFEVYGKAGLTCYDPFMGSGTTAVACLKYGMNYIGSEISENQIKFSEERIAKIKGELIEKGKK